MFVVCFWVYGYIGEIRKYVLSGWFLVKICKIWLKMNCLKYFLKKLIEIYLIVKWKFL